MARMEYDENLVSQAIDEINSAKSAIEGVGADMQAGFSTILGARGAEYLSVNTSICSTLESSVDMILSDDISTINNKAAMIAEYSEVGFFKKLFYTAKMTNAKVREGFFEFIESGVDFIASGVGAVAGIFNPEFADAVGEFIATEHVDNWYAEQYKNGKYKNTEKYSWYSSESTAAKIFEGVGSAVGLATVGVATGSVGGMALASGASAWGKDMQSNLQEGDSYYKALGKAALTGAGTAAVTYGVGRVASNVFGGLGNAASNYATAHLKSGGILAGVHNAVLVNGAAAAVTGAGGTLTGSLLSGNIFDKDSTNEEDDDVKERKILSTCGGGNWQKGTGVPTEAPTVATTPETETPTETTTNPKTYPSGGGSYGGGGGSSDTPTTSAPTVVPTDPTQPTSVPTTPTTPPTVAPQKPYIPSTGDDSNGGGYTGDEGFTGEDTELPDDGNELSGSLTGSNNYVNIPTSSTPINTTTTTSGKKSIIPVIAGLGAAAIAGIGTKSYLDKKEEEKSEEEIDTEEWTGDEQIDLGYTEENLNGERDYLNPTDEFAYEDGPEESYEAVNSSELASMQ